MQDVLTGFVRALRLAGVRVSTAEAMDAARVVMLVGYADRDSLKAALGSAMAKSQDEKAVHDNVFDRFFARPDDDERNQSDPADRETRATEDPSERLSGDAPQQEQAQGLVALAEGGDPAQIALAMERAAQASGVDDMKFRTQTGYFTRRMLEELGLEELERRMIERLREGGDDDAEAHALMRVRADMQRRARAFVQQRFEAFGKSATENFLDEVVLDRSIRDLSLRDMERLKVLIRKLAKRLSDRHARRRRKRLRGQVDVRATLRRNFKHDATPFELVWRRKRIDRPKLVAICDVSGSVAPYVRFLLMFLQAMHAGVRDMRAFAFASRLEDVGHLLEAPIVDETMSRVLRRVSGSTDYGAALVDLREQHWDAIDRRTTVIILGDGRSNYSDPRLDIFQELANQAKRVIWLQPESPGSWGTGDSCILKYKTFCSSLTHIATVKDLEQKLDDMLSVYR
jgi:uncharacterized protein